MQAESETPPEGFDYAEARRASQPDRAEQEIHEQLGDVLADQANALVDEPAEDARPSYEINERHAFVAGAEFMRDSIRAAGRGRNRVWSHASMTRVFEAADEYLEGKR